MLAHVQPSNALLGKGIKKKYSTKILPSLIQKYQSEFSSLMNKKYVKNVNNQLSGHIITKMDHSFVPNYIYLIKAITKIPCNL